jgi:putative flippase GtrA
MMSNLIEFTVVKYAIVGIGGLIIDFSITYTCKEKLRWNKFLSNSIGFYVAVISNFLLNKNWTFNQYSSNTLLQFLQFFVVSLIGLGINNLLLYLFTKKIKANFYLLKLFVIVFVFVWNYAMNFFFTFNRT